VLILVLKDCGCKKPPTALHERACYCSVREVKLEHNFLLEM